VSGRPRIVLVADAAETMADLIEHLAEVDRAGLTDWALIGGLAVMARLAEGHRSTGDIDMLSRQTDPPAKAALLHIAAEETSTGVRLTDGTKIDIIEVATVLNLDDLPESNEQQRMFALAHWWMADTAELVALTLIDRDDGTRVRAELELRLARSAALVAAKLQSIPTRRGRTQDKRESDAYDVYRLLQADRVAKEIPSALAMAPGELGPWCVSSVEDLFIVQATRTARWISSMSPGEAAEPGDIEALGSVFTEALRTAMNVP
jgi:hypothetical protein